MTSNSRLQQAVTRALGVVLLLALCALYQFKVIDRVSHSARWVSKTNAVHDGDAERVLGTAEGGSPSLCQDATPSKALGTFDASFMFDQTSPTPNYKSTPAERARQRGIESWNTMDFEQNGQYLLPPLVSVIVPYYNAHEFIDETLLSLKAQTLKRFEVIIIDDISTERDAIKKLEALSSNNKDPRLRIIDAPRKLGLSGARNYAVNQSKSDFVFWCDPDDLIEPTTLEKMYWFLQSYSSYAWVGAFTVGFGEKDYLWKKNFQLGDAILNTNVAHNAALVRKALHLEIGGFDENVKVFEDWDYWMNMANHGYWGHTIPDYLCWYRQKSASLVTEGEGGWRKMDRSAFSKSLQGKFPNAFAHFPEPKIIESFADGLEYHLEKSERNLEQILNIESTSSTLSFPENDKSPGGTKKQSAKDDGKHTKRMLLMVPWMKAGGADEINVEITRQMTELHGWEVTILGTAILSESEEDEMLTSWKHYDSCGGLAPRFQRFTDDIFCISAFLSVVEAPIFISYLFKTRKPDVVLISHSELGYRLLPWMRISFPDSYFVDLIHLVERTWKAGGYPFFSVLFSPLLDQTITISAQLKNWLVQRGVNSDKVSVYYFVYDLANCRDSGINTQNGSNQQLDNRKIVRSKFGLSEEDVVIIFVGRFALQKRPELVLEIADSLCKQGDLQLHPWKIVMIGDGPRMSPIEKKYNSKSLGKVRQHLLLLGKTSHKDTMDLLQVSDAFLLPSENEGISIATAEAMSFGLTVVCSDVGAQSELVKPEFGFLVPFEEGSKKEVANYVRHIKDIITHPLKGTTMGQAARNHVCSYETQSMLPILCQATRERLKSPPINVDYIISLNTFFSFEDFKWIRSSEDFYQS